MPGREEEEGFPPALRFRLGTDGQGSYAYGTGTIQQDVTTSATWVSSNTVLATVTLNGGLVTCVSTALSNPPAVMIKAAAGSVVSNYSERHLPGARDPVHRRDTVVAVRD